MTWSRIVRFVVVALLAVAGVWLIADSAELQVETPARQQAVLALGPAGQTLDTATDAVPAQTFYQGTSAAPGIITAEDLRNAPAPRPDYYYEQYLAGNIDVENFIDGPAPDAYIRQLQEEALNRPVDRDIQADGGESIEAIINIGVNVPALQYSTTSGLTPPDPEIAVGNNHVVEVVNSTASFYRKSDGAEVFGPIDLSPILQARGCPSTGSPFYFDPVANYDEENDRYVISIMVSTSGTDYLCVAVSQTSTPLGGWYVYSFDCSLGNASLLCDNHEIGVGYDAIYFAADMFSNGFPRVFAMDKDAMYAGAPANYVVFSLSSAYFNLRPVKMLGYDFGGWPANPNEPHYFVATPFGGGGAVQLWTFNDPWGTPSFTFLGSLPTTTHSFPVSQPQLGGPSITANDDRLLDAKYWGGKIWATHTVGCNPGSGTVNCVRWYEVDVTGSVPALVQNGTFSSPGEYRSFPDLSVNSCGQMAVGYTKFSASTYPSVFVAGRAPSTPTGTLLGELPLHVGSTTHTCYANRWGDYLDMTIDPTDGKTFWYIGQYAEPQATCTWATRLVSFSTSSCAP